MIANKFDHIPDELSCTSLPRQWGIPRTSVLKPSTAMNHTQHSPKSELYSTVRRKRQDIACTLFEGRTDKTKELSTTDVEKLKLFLEADFPDMPMSYILQVNTAKVSTQFGEVSDFSPLSYQLANYESSIQSQTTQSCVFTALPIMEQLNDAINCTSISNSFYEAQVVIDISAARKLEEETVSQSNCEKWHKERSKRICSSMFGLVIQHYKRKTLTDNFIRGLFTIKNLYNVKSIRHGRCHENAAKQAFLKHNEGSHIHKIGLIVHPSFPFLGTSPDAIVCSNGSLQLLEVKAPYKYWNEKINSLIVKRDFYLQKDGENVILDQKHMYYAQVQGQMLVSGIKTCNFAVYTN